MLLSFDLQRLPRVQNILPSNLNYDPFHVTMFYLEVSSLLPVKVKVFLSLFPLFATFISYICSFCFDAPPKSMFLDISEIYDLS
jgi:hypothetical protein